MLERTQFARDAMRHAEHLRSEAMSIDPSVPRIPNELSKELSSKG
jgi:hypothetical protein